MGELPLGMAMKEDNAHYHSVEGSIGVLGEYRHPTVRLGTQVGAAATGASLSDEVPSRGVLVQCPRCKTMETLQFVGQIMTPSRKFRQSNGQVYHDCGSDRPCRLCG